MGLCKCPKKKVTNQFCFEHRVNVCESCMVTDHQKCVVQSYLQWLNDSDYNPVCRICDDQLATDECVRLICYDLFHKECLNSWGQKFPLDTAPAGYKCPVCSTKLFPPNNLESPISDALKQVLSEWPWAHIGLDRPLLNDDQKESFHIEDVSNTNSIDKQNSTPVHSTREDVFKDPPPPKPTAEPVRTERKETFVPAVADNPVVPSHYQFTNDMSNSGMSRKTSSSDAVLTMNEENDVDDQENKYKRRSAFELFGRWWRTMQRPSSRHHQGLLGGRRRMIVILVVLGIISVIVLLSYFSRGRVDDPSLDPFNNPNIRIQEEE